MRTMLTSVVVLVITGVLGAGCQSGTTGYSDIHRTKTYRELRAVVDTMRIIDSHQHLITEAAWLAMDITPFTFFAGYLGADLQSAGFRYRQDAGDRWRQMSPYWEFVKFTGYGQALRIAARDLYGIEEISDATWPALSDSIMVSHRAGFYDETLRGKARIDLCIQDSVYVDPFLPVSKPDWYLRVRRFDHFVELVQPGRNALEGIQREYGRPIRSLADLIDAMDQTMTWMVAEKFVGIKCGLAYRRILEFNPVDSTAAAAVLPRYLSGTASPDDIKLYQDFMVHKIAELAGRHHLPVQIHTGLQTGNGNIIKNANPAHLATLFLAHRNTRFMLFHGGYPYMGEVATIVKNFPNVYVDMCWMTIIAPTSSHEWLYHWLETVPYNKILAYGGDTQTPWTSYGSSVMARDCVAEVLARKVEEGTVTMQDARIIARRLLRDNAVEFYRLEPFL